MSRKSTKIRRRKSGRAIAKMMSRAAFLVTLGMTMGWGMLPAIASKLTAWNYDEQTRSLTLTLPANVTPSVSVIAPNQMLVELPDTQIGDVAGQNVGDGLVESITLKQTTSDKVWMVVNFVPGTALATQQNAVPLGGSATTPEGSTGSTASDPLAADASLQQWQVRPALVAGRPDNSLVSASVEGNTAESDTATVTAPSALSSEAASLPEGGAANLSERGDAIAQTPMFPELPVLEPAMPINAPVSVPPIDARPVPAQPAQLVPVQAAAPPIQVAPPVQASVPSVAIPEPPESVSAEQPTVNSSDLEVPLEPPFIGELQGEVNNPVVDELAPSEPAVAASPPTSAPSSSTDRPSTASDTVIDTASEPASAAESAAITADGSNPKLANAASPEVATPEIDIPVENAHTPSTNRWPEPIPFGQPLP